MATIGEKIRELREKEGLTQEELASYIDSTKQTIYKYENDLITNIPSDKIEKLAKALQTSPSYLMGWEIDTDDKELSPEELQYKENLKVLKEHPSKITDKEAFENLQKTMDIKEHTKSVSFLSKDFNDLLLGVNGSSITHFFHFLNSTFPDIDESIDIYDFKKLFEDVRNFTEYNLMKLLKTNKNNDLIKDISTKLALAKAHEAEGAFEEDSKKDVGE